MQHPNLAVHVAVQPVTSCIGTLYEIGMNQLIPILGDPSFALRGGVDRHARGSGGKDQEEDKSNRNTAHLDNPRLRGVLLARKVLLAKGYAIHSPFRRRH